MTTPGDEVTIVICSYNGRARLDPVLVALAAQDSDGFDVVLVDNNSTDGTAAFASSHPAVAQLRKRSITFRVVPEERQGLSFARLRGVAEATNPLVCFLDDDNIPEPGYVGTGLRFFRDHDVSLACSRVRPRWESPPPRAIVKRSHLLALNDHLYQSDVFWPAGTVLPPTLGAGLWCRRDDFNSILKTLDAPVLLDRVGGAMSSGGDIELGHRFCASGRRCAFASDLKILHAIPRGRFGTQYFVRLIIGVVRSEATLRLKYSSERSRVTRTVAAMVGLLLATAGLPLLLLRADPLREIAFVYAARWGRLLGPYDASK